MSAEAMNPLEAILRMVAAAAPQPWFPRLYAAKTGYPLDRVHYLLEHLWLDGLLQKGSGSPETGGGVVLSPAGEEVLRDPDALQRLRDGEPIKPDDRGGIVRTLLRQQRRPVLTRLLLWANVLWFAYGLYLAYSRHQAAQAFLSTFGNVGGNMGAAVAKVRHQTGAVSADDLIHGQWWRLLSCCFVHVGLIHIACNMFGLYVIGRGTEQMWGRWRYLAIYLLSGFGGSCAALAFRPGVEMGDPPQFILSMLAGASGALCGIMGAELVWLLLNGRYLPRPAVRRWWWAIAINLLMLGGFSAMANVSALAHGGGLAVGAFAALLLNVQRFGPAGGRWVMLLPLAALPWLGIELIQRQRVGNELWHKAEERVYYRDYRTRLNEADDTYRRAKNAKADLTAEKRLALVHRAQQDYEAIEADLARADYRAPEVVESRQEILEGIANKLKKLKEQEETLRPLVEKEANRKAAEDKDQRKNEEEKQKELAAFDKTYRQRITDTTAAAEKVYFDQVKAEKRDPAELEAARKTLVQLADDLKAVGKYHSDAAEDQRQYGLDYVVDLERLLSTGWTKEEAAKRKELSITVELRRSHWENSPKK